MTGLAPVQLSSMSDICFQIDPSNRLFRSGQAGLGQLRLWLADIGSLTLALWDAAGLQLAPLPLASKLP
jgi:hypothetical protein